MKKNLLTRLRSSKKMCFNGKNRWNVPAMLGLVLLLGLAIGCRKNASWNTDWVVPLINDRLDVTKFVNDSTLEENNGFYALNFKRNLYDFSLTDIVGIPDTTIDRSSSLNFSSITVNPGFVFFNTIEEHALNLQDLELKFIELSAGKIDFQLSNPVATGVYITIELPGATLNGVMLSKTFFISSGTIANPSFMKETIDLRDYKLDLRGTNGDSFNKLQSRVIIKSDPNGNTVNVTNAHLFNVKSSFKDVKLKYARGYFGSRILEEEKEFNIKALNSVVSGMIDIPNTSIKLTLENGIKVDGRGIIPHLTSTNKNTNVSVALSNLNTFFTIDEPEGSFNTLIPSSREFLFNSTNSNIEQFIENLGSKYDVAYKIQINPWGNTSGGWNEVYPQSRLRMILEAQMPLSIRMDALTVRDTFAINFEQNKDKSHIGSGMLQLDLDNGFPFAGKLKLIFLDEAGNYIDMTNGSHAIESSLFGVLNAQNVMHKTSRIDIPLNAAVVDQLNVIKKIVVEAVFDTPNPNLTGNQMVSIPVDAFLGIRAKAKFQLKMKV